MKRERVILTRGARCLNLDCPGHRDAVPGYFGYCSPCGQAIRRRINQGRIKKEELIACGKYKESPIDNWLRK